jgi:hypothetical protein
MVAIVYRSATVALANPLFSCLVYLISLALTVDGLSCVTCARVEQFFFTLWFSSYSYLLFYTFGVCVKEDVGEKEEASVGFNGT